MKGETKALLKILIEISAISLFCYIAYFYPDITSVYSALWMLAYIFALEAVLGARSYLGPRRNRDPSSTFHGSAYYVTIGGIILWAVGIWTLGIIHVSNFAFNPIVVSVHIGLLILPLVGFGWMWIVKKFKNPLLFFSRYLSAITFVSLLLLLATPTIVAGSDVSLAELVFAYPSDYVVVYVYISVAVVLIGLYSTEGSSRWSARVSGILALTNIMLFPYIMGWKLNGMDTLGISYTVFSYCFLLSSAIPQFYWAIYLGKLRTTVGVGWE
ncbi:MAG: hypothetical protein NWF14_06150 [Candidatus Bathyarchaeota archaeon]|jgi:hypothetical protein|nr:hypothetical protein [Candidatus Bathyarchaeota archaeon]